MPLANIINNIGIGKIEATFNNLTTTAAAAQNAFTLTNIDAQKVACYLVGNNEIGHDTTVHPLFGAVLGLSESERATTPGQRELATVQLYGVAEILGTTHSNALSVNANRKPIAFSGMVGHMSTTNLANFRRTRGIIINVWDTKRADVLL
jgi:hypothetical protein